jgi:hypothetical protein
MGRETLCKRSITREFRFVFETIPVIGQNEQNVIIDNEANIILGRLRWRDWFNLVQGFQRRRLKCESLRRMTTDAKRWQKLTWPLAR